MTPPLSLHRCHWREHLPISSPPLTSSRDRGAQPAAGFIPAAWRLRCGPSGPFCCDHSRQWEVNPKRTQAQSPPTSSLHPGASHPLLFNGLMQLCGLWSTPTQISLLLCALRFLGHFNILYYREYQTGQMIFYFFYNNLNELDTWD